MNLKNRTLSTEIEYYQEIWNIKKKLVRVFIKLYRQNVSLLFNQTCLNERLLPNHTHTHTHIHIHTHIYIYIYKFAAEIFLACQDGNYPELFVL